MDKLQLTGRNLGRVFKFRSGHLHAMPKQLVGSLPLDIALPASMKIGVDLTVRYRFFNFQKFNILFSDANCVSGRDEDPGVDRCLTFFFASDALDK